MNSTFSRAVVGNGGFDAKIEDNLWPPALSAMTAHKLME